VVLLLLVFDLRWRKVLLEDDLGDFQLTRQLDQLLLQTHRLLGGRGQHRVLVV